MPRLLLVDDEPATLVLFEAVLRPLGAQCVRALDGQQALELLGRESFDLVLLDLMLPHVDGLSVLRALRAREQWVPVIVITASQSRDQRVQGLELGADDVLEKPFDRSVLVARVRTLLRLKAALDENAARSEELERLLLIQRETTGFVAHDLKNPLAVITSNLSFLGLGAKDWPLDLRESLEDSRLAAARMLQLVRSFLSSAMLDQLGAQLRTEDVAVTTLLDEVVRLHRQEAAQRGLSVTVNAPAGVHARGDRALLVRVVENLVENALRHTPSGGRIAVEADSSPLEVRLHVSNDGEAPDADAIRRLFQAFSPGTASRQGFGLGLYFCRRVAESHGGSIAFAPRDGWPVTFTVALPR